MKNRNQLKKNTMTNWENVNQNTWFLMHDDIKTGELIRHKKSFIWKEDDCSYTIAETSIWAHKFSISNAANELIGNIKPKNWYGTTYIITIHERQYQLEFYNKPLVTASLKNSMGELLIEAGIYTHKRVLSKRFELYQSFSKHEDGLLLSAIVYAFVKDFFLSETGDSDTAAMVLLMSA